MRVLVTYASKYGATEGIAERIARTVKAGGHDVTLSSIKNPPSIDGFDAVVIGSAVYMFHWMKEATDWVYRNAAKLTTMPVWLFSSGPLGMAEVDAQGHNVREGAAAKEIAVLSERIHPRDHHMFFGAFDRSKLSLGHKMVVGMPALRELMPDGDFRDWKEVDAWAQGIAGELTPAPVK